MKIPLDRRSADPVYLQIRDRIARLIQSGLLKPGDRLPSIRSLAETVRVNKLTVIEAYSRLEADGLIHARAGSGYFVNAGAIAPPAVTSEFAPSQDVLLPDHQPQSYFDIYMASTQASHQPDRITFSSGFPSSEDVDTLQRTARRAMKALAETLFHYDLPQGQLTLRHQIAQLLLLLGLEISPDQLIVTNGSMQGLSLAIRYYVRPGDWVIVESPTYHGALAIFQDWGARVIGIPMTRHGMNLDLLAQYLDSHRPKLIYTISTLHNPTGVTTSQDHRRALLDLATRYQCQIVEDNAYEGLNFGGVPAPIKALDTSDRVTYLGTFSKTLMPGLRVGYMVVTGAHYQPLLERKLLDDLSTSTVAQAVVSEYLASGHYRHHLGHLRRTYQASRNAMLKALEQHFPPDATWTVPDGGLFLWVHLPNDVPVATICHDAAQHNIIVAPGATFFPNQRGYPALRLNFAQSISAIEHGIAVLGEIIQRHHPG